jgi:RNA polymerase sigma factor (sigma-70 family)
MPSPSFTLLRTQSDDRLVALAGAGHERAFEAIVERYRRPLLRAARRVLPESRAEDALQQALVAAWTALQRGDEVRDLRSWLYRIVHNTALNALRGNGYDYDELEDTLRITDAGDDELERRAVVRQTLASLAALPDRQREALLRTAVSGYSQEEVARDLGISDNAMRQLIHRARCSMRAAATAVTPLPLITALASGARSGPLVDRIAELAAGAAPAGAGAGVTLAKAGTVAVLAGGALSGPALVDRVADRPPREATAAAATPHPASRAQRPEAPARGASAAPAPVAARIVPVAHGGPSKRSSGSVRPRGAAPEHHRSRSGDSNPRSGGRDDSSGDDGTDDRSPSSGSGSGGSGSGSDDLGSGEATDTGSGSGGGSSDDSEPASGSGSGGSGSGDVHDDHPSGDDAPAEPEGGAPAPLPVATVDSHGPGHGSDDEPDTE